MNPATRERDQAFSRARNCASNILPPPTGCARGARAARPFPRSGKGVECVDAGALKIGDIARHDRKLVLESGRRDQAIRNWERLG
jgi:hypothetical protein